MNTICRLLLLVLALFLANTTWAQRALTMPDFTMFSMRNGVGAPYIQNVLPLPDGGAVVIGKFEVWYEGVQIRDVLRLKSDGLPDTGWRVSLNKDVVGALVLPRGVLLYGVFDVANGEPVTGPRYLSFDGAKRLRFDMPVGVSRVLAGSYDPKSGWTYLITDPDTFGSDRSVFRVHAQTGNLDASWGWKVPHRPDETFTSGPLVDESGGLWLT